MIEARILKRYAAFDLDVEFAAPAGVTVLFGASGAGKTLTLDCLAGFATPDDGRILLNGEILFDAAAGVNFSPQRRNCGYVFQDHALFPHMTVRQNLLFAAERHPRLERHRRVRDMMERFRLTELADRSATALSGGQKQRCSLARSLVAEPKFLLLDEPARGLDVALRTELYDLVGQVRREFPIPILVVTHDLAECFALGEGMLIFKAGKILQSGAPKAVYGSPGSADVAGLLGIANQFEAEIIGLDPGRGTSRLRFFGQEFAGMYLPGHLLGDVVRLWVPASALRVVSSFQANCLRARVVRMTEMPNAVRVQFDPALTVEVSGEVFAQQEGRAEWTIEVPAAALRLGS